MSDAAKPPQIIELQPPKPHSKKQALIMGFFKMPEVKEIWVSMGTKFGKSIGFATAMSVAACEKDRSKWRWVAPRLDQAVEIGMDYCLKVLPPAPHVTKNLQGPYINITGNESRIEFWHTKDPKGLEGPGINGYCLDEVAKMPYEAYAAARTTLTFTKGKLAGFSYPYGKNWFYKKCEEARAEMQWAVKKGVPPEKIFLHARTIDNPLVDPAIVLAAQKELPDRLFRQYYLAEFCDSGDVFIGYRNCLFGNPLDLWGAVQHWLEPGCEEREVVIAADWAKIDDYTVFGAFDYKADKPRLVGFHRFHGLSYLDAVKELYRFSKKFKKVGIVYHDKTGVGEAIDDMLAQIGLPIYGVVFSARSKTQMVNALMLNFEKQMFELPHWPEMLKELEAFEVQTNALGHLSYNAPKGQHDDIVSMLMLGNAALAEYSGKGMEVRVLEEIGTTKLSLDKWYNELLEDTGNDAAHLFR